MLEALKPAILSGTRAAVTSSGPKQEQYDEVDALLERYSFLAWDDGKASGVTPLRCAMLESSLSIAEAFIRRGADVQALLKYGSVASLPGNTILHDLAFYRNAPAEINFLLDHRAQPGVKGMFGLTALFCATVGGWSANVEVLLRRCRDKEDIASWDASLPWMAAVQWGHELVFHTLLKMAPERVNRDPNTAGGHDYNPVILAACDICDTKAISAALDAGYDINHQQQIWRMQLKNRFLLKWFQARWLLNVGADSCFVGLVQ